MKLLTQAEYKKAQKLAAKAAKTRRANIFALLTADAASQPEDLLAELLVEFATDEAIGEMIRAAQYDHFCASRTK